MTDTVKKTKAPAKPRKTAAKTPAETIAVTPAEAPKGVSHEEVARLAHRFFIERGRQHGHHVSDWFRAEQELRGKAS